jgi:hypothetical protein
MKRLASHALLIAALCCAGAPAFAHRFHIGIAEIAFNPKTGSVEVVHTYMAHDIEPLLASLAGRDVDLGSPEAEALLKKYTEARFYLLDAGRARLPLRWVGMTVNVDSVVIYQELPATTLEQVRHVHDEVLTDLLPRQANTVNVHLDGQLKSFEFSAKTVERRLK